MSIATKALRELRKELGRGGYKKVAERLSFSPEWIGQVLRDVDLSEKHQHIIHAALDVVKEKKQIRWLCPIK